MPGRRDSVAHLIYEPLGETQESSTAFEELVSLLGEFPNPLDLAGTIWDSENLGPEDDPLEDWQIDYLAVQKQLLPLLRVDAYEMSEEQVQAHLKLLQPFTKYLPM